LAAQGRHCTLLRLASAHVTAVSAVLLSRRQTARLMARLTGRLTGRLTARLMG
jgi:hypothetical protein